MRTDAGEPDFSWGPRQADFLREAAERPDPSVTATHWIAETIIETAGPLFWAALVVGFVTDLFGVGILR
jgi:hypothetical protein